MAKSPHHAAAALTRIAQVGGHEVSAPARAAFNLTFVDQVDPDRTLPEAERAKRAEAARRAYFLMLAAKSAESRRRKSTALQRKADADELRRLADEIEAAS
jgi:hypothetical protein